MVITSIYETFYDGMYKVQVENEGTNSVFFIRQEYLNTLKIENLIKNIEYDKKAADELLDAGLACVVEIKALDYLARAEQSRFGLYRKLIEKKYDKNYINKALDFLEAKNYLSDERFARAWLNSRKINHYEGKTKLLAELQIRGIDKDIATVAVDNFFIENDELEICKKAYEKLIKRGKTEEKLVAAMMNAGFSYKLIKSVKEAYE